jgi:RHS repeat-associated protein
MSNATGGIAIFLARYDPFGNYSTPPGTTVNPTISDRGFTGHRQNNTGANDLGLIYMNARCYLPEVGRFVSADTIVPEPQNPQDWNRYTYTRNNPITYTDPSGHLSVEEIEQYFGF